MLLMLMLRLCLQGNLFDSGVINSVFDMFEDVEDVKYSVLNCDGKE